MNIQNIRKHFIGTLAAFTMVFASFAGTRSNEAVVFLEPEKSSFWQTATNSTITLPVCFPEGAASAELTVSGLGYRKVYSVSGDSCTVALPPATALSSENVYGFTLAFDNGVTNHARLGLIQGLGEDGCGSTRCLLPEGSRKWNAVPRTAVIPIPYGISSFMLNGIETDTCLGGAQGWYAIGPLSANVPLDVEMATGEGELLKVSLAGKFSGFFLHLR